MGLQKWGYCWNKIHIHKIKYLQFIVEYLDSLSNIFPIIHPTPILTNIISFP